jgi:hypothetical protein
MGFMRCYFHGLGFFWNGLNFGWFMGVAFRSLLFLAGALSMAASFPATNSHLNYSLTVAEAGLVDEVQQRSFRFFDEQTDPISGLTRDRAPADGGESDAPASIAATGFALTAWCIADQRGWLPKGEGRRRVLNTLTFVLGNVQHERGWIYHFINARTGRRTWSCEASTIDTALFLQGALGAREYFNDPEVRGLVDAIYARIDWSWALNGGKTLSHGWRPETGFIVHRWDSYSEMLGMYLLGIGAPGNALPAETWHAWARPKVSYGGRTFIQCAPLFTHQYSHAWFDFRGLRDGYADYWQNSVDATLAQREWCADRSGDFSHWSRELWGVTASDGPRGYMAWGGPFGATDKIDGTLVPCAPGGSLPFAPRECLAALQTMRQIGGSNVWRRYGFVDAFNPQTGWVSPDVIGIDVGITLIMAENLRTGQVWRDFMGAAEVKRGLRLAGFAPVATPPPGGAAAANVVAMAQ